MEVFGEDVPLETIRRHITVTSIERFGVSWDERYGELKAFKDTYGHCNVPITWEQNPKLAVWIQNTHQLRKQECLSEERTKALDELGFVWKVRHRPIRRLDWSEMLESLVALQKAQATAQVSLNNSLQLRSWTNRIRRERVAGKLSDEQITTLDGIGFDWTTPPDRWNSMFTALVEYKRTYGDCNVPKTWRDNPQLAIWVTNQREKFEEQTIKPDFRQRLESVGFEWQPEKTDPWEEMFAALVEFKRQHGHCKVPRTYADVPRLANWVSTQRAAKQKGGFDASKVSRLEAIGFAWNVIAESWEMMFDELKQYQKDNGDRAVPTNRPEYKRLASWISQQRIIWRDLQNGQRQARQHTLSRMKRLEEIGIDFGEMKGHEICWDDNYAALQQYKAQHGDCNIPSQSAEHPILAVWVRGQRVQMKAGTLTAQQIDRLTNLGFIWNLHELNSQRMYEALVAYKLQYGDCDVQMNWPTNLRLARWVPLHRTAENSGKLTANRFQLLDELGFIWQKQSGRWPARTNIDE